MRLLLLIFSFFFIKLLSYGQGSQISGGNNFSIGLCGSGAVYAWGSNSSGQIGTISAGTPYPGADYTTPQIVYLPSGLTFSQVSAGSGATALALTCKGNVYAWGENKCGQVGMGVNSIATSTTCGANGLSAVSIPVSIPFEVVGGLQGGAHLSNIKYISGGDDFSIAIDSNGLVYTWGENDNGSLGNGTTVLSNSPVVVQNCSGGNLTNIVMAKGGEETGYALDATGQVWAWGLNDNKDLGTGSVAAFSTCASPVVKDAGGTPLSGIKMIDAGDTHGMALDSSGQIWTWGGDWGPGQLGQGTTYISNTYASRVVAVDNFIATGTTGPFITNATYIAAGQASSIAVLSNGNVVSFGANGLYPGASCGVGQLLFSGTLGNGTASKNMTCQSNETRCTFSGNIPASCSGYGAPQYVETNVFVRLSKISTVTRGDAWYFAIDSSGLMYVWGFNGAGGGLPGGQLGIGNKTDQPYAVPLSLPTGCNIINNSQVSPCTGEGVTTGISAQSMSDDFIQISPNPATNVTNISFKGNFNEVNVSLYSSIGEQLFSKEIGNANDTSQELILAGLPAGIYLVEINSSQGNIIKRVVKQ